MEPANRAEIPRETASGLPRSPRSSAFFPTKGEKEIPFFPPPSPPLPPLRRSNFPSDVRRDFRESKDPFSKDPILSRLSGTREPGLSRPLFPLGPFLSLGRVRYSFIYSLARLQTTGAASFRVESIRTFRIRGLLRIGTSEIRIAPVTSGIYMLCRGQ